MNFEMALQAMERGERVARPKWHRCWICLGEGNARLAAESFWNKHTRALAERNGGFAEVLPYFILGNESGSVQMGWSPSQADVLAADWSVVYEGGAREKTIRDTWGTGYRTSRWPIRLQARMPLPARVNAPIPDFEMLTYDLVDGRIVCEGVDVGAPL